jgi:hypothetical protein
MLSWQHLARLPDRELARVDIVLTNLACAAGLPGSEQIDVELCLRTVNTWAMQTRQFTERVMPMFYRGRCDYPDSEPRFRIQAMITHLQRDLGVRYHPDKRSDDAVLEPADCFLHGIIQGQGGTCGSLPVLYAAVGRRLGYPLMLATAPCHLYARWDALPWGECFNIEAGGEGVSFPPDDHYRTGRFAVPPETIKVCSYLQSFSPRQELANFLGQRGGCWMQERVWSEAVMSFAWANEADPRWGHYLAHAYQVMRKWHEELHAQVPSRFFPTLDIGLPRPYFIRMPRELEREFIRMLVMERVLKNPNCERDWWGPMRCDPQRRPKGVPERLRIDFDWHGLTRVLAPST